LPIWLINSEIKLSSLPENEKFIIAVTVLDPKPVNQQTGSIFISGVSKGMLTEKELWEKL
jgi:hypothetical protein